MSDKCPFCGVVTIEIALTVNPHLSTAIYCVTCRVCGATGPRERSRSEALDAWRNREGERDEQDNTG